MSAVADTPAAKSAKTLPAAPAPKVAPWAAKARAAAAAEKVREAVTVVTKEVDRVHVIAYRELVRAVAVRVEQPPPDRVRGLLAAAGVTQDVFRADLERVARRAEWAAQVAAEDGHVAAADEIDGQIAALHTERAATIRRIDGQIAALVGRRRATLDAAGDGVLGRNKLASQPAWDDEADAVHAALVRASAAARRVRDIAADLDRAREQANRADAAADDNSQVRAAGSEWFARLTAEMAEARADAERLAAEAHAAEARLFQP